MSNDSLTLDEWAQKDWEEWQRDPAYILSTEDLETIRIAKIAPSMETENLLDIIDRLMER